MADIGDSGMSVSEFLGRLCADEVWRDVKGYPGYRVSSHGRVGGIRREVLTPVLSSGYLIVSLCRNGLAHNERINRLVATAFLGDPPFNDAHSAHNDGNRLNNWATNLRWTNALDNQADVERHGNRVKGSAVRNSKLKEENIPEIRSRVSAGDKYDDIAADFGVTKFTISLIKLGKIWRHV